MVESAQKQIVDNKNTLGLEQRKSFVGFARDEATASTLREGLNSLLDETADIRIGTLAEAIAAFGSMLCPRFILVDVSGEPDPIFLLTELTGVVEPDVKVLVIGDSKDLNFYREIKQSLCVSEYLYKPLTIDLVTRVFAPIFDKDFGSRSIVKNSLITVTGAGGGVGATTLVVNLAKFLADNARRNTLIYDPDLHSGGCALLLDVDATTSMKMVFEAPDRVDQFVVLRAIHRIDDRLSILSGDLNYQVQLNYARGAVEHSLRLIENKYNFIVADVAIRNRSIAQEFFEFARQQIIVVQPTLSSLKEAVKLLGIPPSPQAARRPIIVLNSSDLPGGLDANQVEGILQQRPDVTFPHIPELANTSQATAEPLIEKSSVFREGIIKIASEFDTKIRAGKASKKRLFGMRSKLLSRFQR